jgi:murein DD-endopeptidase MepM/ murein hydrolase activator NlpD
VSSSQGPGSTAFNATRTNTKGQQYAHKGVDISSSYANNTTRTGAPVYAVEAGIIIDIVTNPKSDTGLMVVIQHTAKRLPNSALKGTIVTKYMHLSSLSNTLAKNKHIEKNTQLGIEGGTGRSTGVHLHFELSLNGQVIDPAPYLDPEVVTVRG